MAYEVIEAPAPGPVRRGLLAPGGSLPATVAGVRWVGPLGFTWRAASCSVADPQPLPCNPADAAGAKPGVPDRADEDREVVAVGLFGVNDCESTFDQQGSEERARRHLELTQSWQLAREFWDGVASRAASPDLPNDYLAKGGSATVLGSGPVPLANALAWLEDALGDCLHGQQGMIHASPYTAAMWDNAGLVRRAEGSPVWLTPNDHILVVDAGYSGSAPDADAGDAPIPPADITAAANVYGTGIVYHLLGNVRRVAGEARWEIDRATNSQVTRVERAAAAMWSGCCHLTIEVDHTTEVGPAA